MSPMRKWERCFSLDSSHMVSQSVHSKTTLGKSSFLTYDILSQICSFILRIRSSLWPGHASYNNNLFTMSKFAKNQNINCWDAFVCTKDKSIMPPLEPRHRHVKQHLTIWIDKNGLSNALKKLLYLSWIQTKMAANITFFLPLLNL